MILHVETLLADQGTVLVFRAHDPATGNVVVFGADHRPAAAIVEALEAGEEVTAEVESWSILGGGE